MKHISLPSRLLTISVAVMAIHLTACSAPPASVQLDSPPQDAVVDQRQELSGKVAPPNTTVIVVTRPMETSDYWVQPSVTVGSDGKWSVLVYFGEPGAAHKGKKFEVRAFAAPKIKLTEGKTPGWPAATAQSEVLRYTRK